MSSVRLVQIHRPLHTCAPMSARLQCAVVQRVNEADDLTFYNLWTEECYFRSLELRKANNRVRKAINRTTTGLGRPEDYV